METKNAFLMISILAVSAVLLSGCISSNDNVKACTADAKLCPDGSAVGRIGPDCEFAPCPQLVGNDSDIHGCKASAGYSWCEAKQKCLRVWEENCSSCTCPDNYVKEGDACNPKCYYSTPPCLMPSIQCKPAGCGECPQYMPPGPDFCKNGTIVSGETNECGCVGPPRCEQNFGSVGIANPASVYCEQNGGTLEIVDEVGGQIGICTLSNGTKCEEWAFFRGECGSHVCTAEEKAAEMCTMEYMPVCGNDNMTYGNKCSACGSGKIDSWVAGECSPE